MRIIVIAIVAGWMLAPWCHAQQIKGHKMDEYQAGEGVNNMLHAYPDIHFEGIRYRAGTADTTEIVADSGKSPVLSILNGAVSVNGDSFEVSGIHGVINYLDGSATIFDSTVRTWEATEADRSKLSNALQGDKRISVTNYSCAGSKIAINGKATTAVKMTVCIGSTSITFDCSTGKMKTRLSAKSPFCQDNNL